MIQLLTQTTSGEITTADTNLHAFPATPARLIILSAPKANTGNVKITGTGQTAGIDLVPGTQFTVSWLINLSLLSYQTATSGDKIQYLIAR